MLTPASMVPNTVTPLPPEDAPDESAGLDGLPAELVPAQPDTSTPMAIANTAATIGFNGNFMRWLRIETGSL